MVSSFHIKLHRNTGTDRGHSGYGRFGSLAEFYNRIGVGKATLRLPFGTFVYATLWGVDPDESQELSVLTETDSQGIPVNNG